MNKIIKDMVGVSAIISALIAAVIGLAVISVITSLAHSALYYKNETGVEFANPNATSGDVALINVVPIVFVVVIIIALVAYVRSK